ncbi:MAG: hypothetical protein ABL903_20710 [Methylococcales bacterium]
MAVIKRAIREDFEVILRATMQDKSISLDAKGLLFHLLSLPSDWEVHVWWLKKELNVGDDKMKRMLKELETAQYLVRKRVNSGGGIFKWDMVIYQEPQSTIVGLSIDGSTIDGLSIDGQPHDKENTEHLQNTELENTQPRLQKNCEPTLKSLKFPKNLDARLIDEVKAILKNTHNAQNYIDELAAALDQNKIKAGPIPWLKAAVQKGLYRTQAGFKKEDQRLKKT